MTQTIDVLSLEELQSYYLDLTFEREELKHKRDEAMKVFQRSRGVERMTDEEWKVLNEGIRDYNKQIDEVRSKMRLLENKERRRPHYRRGEYNGYQRS